MEKQAKSNSRAPVQAAERENTTQKLILAGMIEWATIGFFFLIAERVGRLPAKAKIPQMGQNGKEAKQPTQKMQFKGGGEKQTKPATQQQKPQFPISQIDELRACPFQFPRAHLWRQRQLMKKKQKTCRW